MAAPCEYDPIVVSTYACSGGCLLIMLFSFDLDGVLQINPFYSGVFPKVAQLVAPYLANERGISRQDALPLVTDLIVQVAHRRLRQEEWVAAYDWDDIVHEVASAVGYPQPDSISVAALVRRYCAPGYIKLHDHAVSALEFLQDHGVELMVITNGFDIYQLPVMQALGIDKFFQARFTPEKVGAVKPQPEIFRRAMAASQRVDIAVHVGDSLVQDVYGAHQAGFLTVWVEPDLPASMSAHMPWERAATEAWDEMHTRGISRNTSMEPYDVLHLRPCKPDYIIRHLGEIPAVYEHLTGATALRAGGD